jgi:microcompartment protein CcmK/EutM
MTIVNATENPPFATAIRGYDRAAVDAAVAREIAQIRALASRAAQLERDTLTPPSVDSTPAPRQKVQQALDVIGAGWDEAVLLIATAEHVAAMDRLQAEHSASAAMATVEEQCAQAESAAQDAAKAMVATARDQAADLLEHSAAEHDRAVESAAALVRAAEDRAKEFAEQFTTSLREAEEQHAARVTARYDEADRDVAAARAELAAAERDALGIAIRAQAAREEILTQAQAAADEVLIAAGAEVRRRQAENEAALAELGRLLIATGDHLVSAPAPEPSGRF